MYKVVFLFNVENKKTTQKMSGYFLNYGLLFKKLLLVFLM